MAIKRPKPEEIVLKLQQVEVLTGFVAQIGCGDSCRESSVIAGGHEQLDPDEVQDHKLVVLQ